MQIVDDEGFETDTKQEGNIALKVKPDRPVGFFEGYVVSFGLLMSCHYNVLVTGTCCFMYIDDH